MKIIDKRGKKDYYDFLTGIYGEDPKIILDRRKYDIPHVPMDRSKLTFIIGGMIFEGLWLNNNAYYGENLKQFDHGKKSYHSLWNNKRADSQIYITCNSRYNGEWFDLIPYYDDQNLNKKEDCPILMKSTYGFTKNFYHYPILNDWNLSSIVSPEDMFKLISDWISKKNTEKENFTDNRTDIEKLINKGFDKKTSFRPKIKKI